MVTVKTMRNACASWATPGDEPFTGRLVCNTASWHRCWCGSHFCCMDKFQCHTSLLRHLRVYPTPRPQHFVRMLQIHGHLFRHLVPFRPRSHALEVSALMLRVEVDKRHRLRHAFQLVPHLSPISGMHISCCRRMSRHCATWIRTMSSLFEKGGFFSAT
jgi:hypothetical protein